MQPINIEPNVQNQIKNILDRWYDRGKPVRVQQISGGYCNKSYAVWLEKEGKHTKYFLRQYNPNIAEKEVRFEHALIRHLRNNSFALAADVIGCQEGGTFVRIDDDNIGHPTYWGLFEFLSGEDKYTWTQTDLADEELTSSAEILAQLHNAGRDFQCPAGAGRVQPPIMEFLVTLPPIFKDFARRARSRRSDHLFLDHLDYILAAIQRCLAIKKNVTGLLQLPIHCDYHPGNLKFKNLEVVGLFDFDWSKIDYRLFDVALALVYFVSLWPGQAGGSLRLDKFDLFLKTYSDTCRKLENIHELTAAEERLLVTMLAAANLYVLNWDLMDFYNKTDLVDDEYFTYIDHNIRLMYWIESHRKDLESVIRLACG